MNKGRTSALSAVQRKNYNYFQKYLKQWLKDPVYKYKYLVIHDETVKGVYDRSDTAFRFAISRLPQDEFIIQQVIKAEELIGFIYRAF